MPCKSATLVIALLATFGVSALMTAQEGTTQRSFTGNTVNLNLSPGQYHVTASADDKIRVYPGHEAQPSASKLSVRLDVNLTGASADVTVRPPEERSDVRIEVPKGVNIVATLAGGSLRVGDISGSKDITAQTGTVEISVGNGGQYKRVTASVGRGDLTAPAFGDKGSGARSFEWTGKGAYDLRVRLDAGRLTLKN